MKLGSLALIFVSSWLITACTENVDKIAQDNLYPLSEANQIQVPDTPPLNYSQAFIEVAQASKSIKIHLWAYTNPTNPKASVVIFHHGNGDNIGGVRQGPVLKNLETLGFNFVVFDYPGYGKSEGVPTQASVMASAQGVFDWTKLAFPEAKIHLMGWSLGSAVAVQMANINQAQVSSAIFSSPFKNFISMAVSRFGPGAKLISKAWLKGNAWDSALAAETINIPILITHGTKDTEIPFHFGQELSQKFPAGVVEFTPYEGRTHSSFFNDEKYWDELNQFFRGHE